MFMRVKIKKYVFRTKILFVLITEPFLRPAVGCAILGILDKEVSTNPVVAGAIGRKKHFSFWKNILKAPKDVLNIVRYGYKIPFKGGQPPPSSELPNNLSSLREKRLCC